MVRNIIKFGDKVKMNHVIINHKRDQIQVARFLFAIIDVYWLGFALFNI
jgi:hypothetical protein